VVEITGDKFLVGYPQYTVKFRYCRLAQHFIDGFNTGGGMNPEGNIHNGNIGCRHPNGQCLKLSLQMGQNPADTLFQGSAYRNNGLECRPGFPQIIIIGVNDRLVMHGRMDGGDCPALDAQIPVNNIDDGNQAIGSAGGIGDNCMVRFQCLVIYPVYNGGIHLVFGRIGINHLKGTG